MTRLVPTACVRLAALAAVPPAAASDGETFDWAWPVVSLPFSGAGTTVGRADDYALGCLAADPHGPDVVYAFIAPWTGEFRFDTCGSDYSAALFLFDAQRELLACNSMGNVADAECLDDAVIDGFPVMMGELIYVVIDSRDGTSGAYRLNIDGAAPWAAPCPASAFREGEDEPAPGSAEVNAGCASDGEAAWEPLHVGPGGASELCLTSGWRAEGDRDTDALWATVGPAGTVHLEVTARYGVQVLVLDGTTCEAVRGEEPQVLALRWVADRSTGALDLAAAPGSDILVRIGPGMTVPPWGLFPAVSEVVLRATGLDAPTGAAPLSWGAAKAMFR